MKKNIFWSLLTLLFGTFVFYSCSTKDDVPQEDEMASVSFEFDGATITSGTKTANTPTDPVVVLGGTLCNPSNDPLKVDIVLTKGGSEIIIPTQTVDDYNGKYKTAPYELPAGIYTVNSVTVYNSANVVIYSGVESPSELAPFVPAPTSGTNSYFMKQQQFKLERWTKPTISLYVLCAKGYKATDFGMPKFELNMIDVTCFDLFFNVCDEYGEHQVGEGTIEVYSADGNTLYYDDTFGSGNIGTICFPDFKNITDNDAEKYKIKVTINNTLGGPQVYENVVSVNKLKNFDKDPDWQPSMNALHVVICGTPWCLFCDPCDDNLYENFNKYTDVTNFYATSGWINHNGGLDEIAVRLNDPTNPDKYMLAADPKDWDKCPKTFMWETRKYNHSPKDKIKFDYYVKSDGKYCFECRPLPVKIKVQLKKSDGSMLETIHNGTLVHTAGQWQLQHTITTQFDYTGCASVLLSAEVPDKWYQTCSDLSYCTYKFGFDNFRVDPF